MTNVDKDEVKKFDALNKAWWDKNGELKTLHDINPARLSFIQQHATLEGKKVLDLGCGGGILTEALAKAKAVTTAVDMSAPAIAAAQKHAQKNELDIEYIHSAIEDLSAKLKYDVIVCMEMLEHVPDPQELIKQLYKHLKPNGTLFLSTINRTTKAYLFTIVGAEYLLKIIPQNTHDYKKYIKPSEMANMLRDAGFDMKHLAGLGYNPLTRHAWLNTDMDVNYLAAAKRV